MSKTKTAETIENVEFPSFDASKATDQMRAFAEKGVEQSKEAYVKLKTGAEETQNASAYSRETLERTIFSINPWHCFLPCLFINSTVQRNFLCRLLK